MKNIYFLLIIFLICCTNNKKDHSNTEGVNNYDFENMPNKDTEYDTLYTFNNKDNEKLIHYLKNELGKSNFKFEEKENNGGESFNNCDENKIIILKGNGIRKYFARSTKPERKTKDFYADFIIEVYEFSTIKMAERNFSIMGKALNSKGRFCNGKVPYKLVLNGHEIFYLTTRAEMFRTYTKKYGELIENYRQNQ